MAAARQLRLKLTVTPRGGEEIVASASNAAAIAALETWPKWPGGRLALVGPKGSGKTLLAQAWARRARAQTVARGGADISHLRGGPILVDDADFFAADETLFHLINMTEGGATLLLTATTPPKAWPAVVADLRSRLNATGVAQIEEPDDELLAGVLRKFFREKSIRPADDVYPYLVRRIERSIPAAKDVVSRLDDLADEGQREVTRALARQLFEQEDTTLDLFD